jgi:hypothetical protein
VKLKRQKEDFNSIVAEFEDYVKYCTELVESFDKLYLQGIKKDKPSKNMTGFCREWLCNVGTFFSRFG